MATKKKKSNVAKTMSKMKFTKAPGKKAAAARAKAGRRSVSLNSNARKLMSQIDI